MPKKITATIEVELCVDEEITEEELNTLLTKQNENYWAPIFTEDPKANVSNIRVH